MGSSPAWPAHKKNAVHPPLGVCGGVFTVGEDKELSVARKEKSKKREGAMRRYWRETIGELRRVTWPTRQEATRLTVLVLIVMTSMSLFLWSIDVGTEALLALALGAR